MNDRIELLHQEALARMARHEHYVPDGREPLDLFADPAFAGMSFMLRKAVMVERVLEAVDLRVFPGELITGSPLMTWVSAHHMTFEECCLYADTSFTFQEFAILEEEGGRVYAEPRYAMTPEEIRQSGWTGTGNWSWEHACGGFRRILEMGYLGIAEEADRLAAEMRDSGAIDVEKLEFWEAVSRVSRAVCRLSDRYADYLDSLVATESNAAQAEEWRQCAARMRRVPARPAETFHDALQSVWFAWMCCNRFSAADLGRFDQYIAPYYSRDLAAGILTEESAEELIQCLFLKFFESYIAVAESNLGVHPAIMLAGVNADGHDGTNPITYMCLRAVARFGIPAPKVSVRVNEETPREIFEIAHAMLTSGISQPDFYADRTILPSYLALGILMEDAVEYAQSTCEELSLAGISEDCTNEGIHYSLHHNLMTVMRRISRGAASADSFAAFQMLLEQEIRRDARELMYYHRLQTEKLRYSNPQPLHSAAIVGCLESGRDIMAGGAKYNNTGSCVAGLATAADGLYAIRRLVYEEGRLTIPEYYDILQRDWQDQELLRQEVLHKFPKFGNDVPEVDELAAWLMTICENELSLHENSRGGKYKLGAWASNFRSAYPATPDGRRRGDAFATNISPTPGCDCRGATAVLLSASHLDLSRSAAGGMVDVMLSPSCLRGEQGVEVLRQLVMTHAELGGVGLQFNVTDPETLKKAQADPASYRNLMVRVWGYNDYFVSLEPERQAHIIARTALGV